MAQDKPKTYTAQGLIVVADEDEGPCIAVPFFTPGEKNAFDEQVAAGKLDDGREIFSYLWLGAPIQSDAAHVVAGKMRPFGELGIVIER